jgi:delta14-sterol reductase/lamin-B receptor
VDSFVGDKILAEGGNSGNPFYDFFIGRELNPRIYSFDWKEFCELRPGLLAWMLLNAACMKQQYDAQGYVTGSMILLNVFQGVYVWDALYQERAILTTMDITTDGFGFMLVLGDLAWVPFTYSVQARYLVKHDPHLGYPALAVILTIYIFGYLIFRGANGQKDAFRRNPSDPTLSHLTFLQTKRGTKLLTSGWWGMARKINYTGDYIMGLTWCLVCGFDSIVPYYYAIYFMILLIHRSIRDDHMCQTKYGDDWQAYKRLVPYRFVPGIV